MTTNTVKIGVKFRSALKAQQVQQAREERLLRDLRGIKVSMWLGLVVGLITYITVLS